MLRVHSYHLHDKLLFNGIYGSLTDIHLMLTDIVLLYVRHERSELNLSSQRGLKNTMTEGN